MRACRFFTQDVEVLSQAQDDMGCAECVSFCVFVG